MKLVIMMIEIRIWDWGIRLGDRNLDLGLELEIGLGQGIRDLDWRLGIDNGNGDSFEIWDLY